jgi:hypothetical protein
MMWMYFATLVNIEYVERFGIGTGILRFFLLRFRPCSFAVLMGYFVGQAKQYPQRAGLLMSSGVLIAIFFMALLISFVFAAEQDGYAIYFRGNSCLWCFLLLFIAIRLALRTYWKSSL